MMHFWVDGRMQPSREALFHLELGAFHYGLAAFEGILAIRVGRRGEGRSGVALFRAHEHITRLFLSAAGVGIDTRYTAEDVIGAIRTTVGYNGLNTYYIRPLLFREGDYLRLVHKRTPVRLAILLNSFHFRFFTLTMRRPIALTAFDGLINPFGGAFASLKVSGRYVINMLAKKHAVSLGFDDAVLFDSRGNTTETTSANVFVKRGNELLTPAVGNIIDGITRRTVIKILHQMGIQVREGVISRDELLSSDGMFITGSAAGIVPVARIGDRKFSTRIPWLPELQKRYLDALTGRSGEMQGYLTYL